MAGPDPLRTVAEASVYRRTCLHREVDDFLARLAARTDRVHVETFGTSGLGQALPVAILSAAGRFTPEAAHASGLPILLVVGNIHAGEVEGKESCLMLARDLCLGGLAPLLEQATVLLVPDYNPDGNDRIDPANRALDLARLEGQIGPEGGVGTRYTGAGYNLNRDYTKHDAVESRALAGLLSKWRPHVVVDCHTTDGSLHGYDLTYDTSRNLASTPRGPAVFARDVLLPSVTQALFQRTGFRTWFYGNFKDEADPGQGWESYPPLARYGSHYRGLRGCVDVLLEAYSYIDFRARCDVTYAILVEILAQVGARGPEIVALVEGAARDTVARGRDPKPDDLVGIHYGIPARDASGALVYRHPGHRLSDVDVEVWDDASHRERRVPGLSRRTVKTTFYGRYEPTVLVRRPFAYVIPASRVAVLDRLAGHGIEMHRLARSVTLDVETWRVTGKEPTASPDVGTAVRTETVLHVEAARERFSAVAGDVVVPMAQRWANLAIYLLEPHGDDGLARWGFFDDVGPGDPFPVRRIPSPVDLPTA